MDDRALTWATLLAGWVELARASRALGPHADDPRWQRSIAPVITLHAVECSLGELHRLDPGERPTAIDRAAILIERARLELDTAWSGRPQPAEVARLIGDASLALHTARTRWRSKTP